MRNNQRQSGATLVVSLIMLLVLTLLVVSAIRFGNTNLRVVGNMQVQTETAAAAQQATEYVIDADNPVDFTTLTAPQTLAITTGPVSSNVVVAIPTCNTMVPIFSTDPSLNSNDPDDRLCIGDSGSGGDVPLDPNGNPIPNQTTCNQQQWDLQADVADGNSGAKISQHQGVSMRKYKPASC